MSFADPSGHVVRLARIYSPSTWDLYAELDQSLRPRGPEWLDELALSMIGADARVLDAGCRDGAHLIGLATRRRDISGFGVDPVSSHVEQGQLAVRAAGLQNRLTIAQGTLEAAPELGEQFDLVWCRDVLEQVADLPAALAGAAKVLKRRGRLLIFTIVTTDRLEPREAAMLNRHLGNIAENLSRPRLTTCFANAGLAIEDVHEIGTEWREYAEERTQPASQALLRLARLRRQQDSVVARHGQDIYDHVQANLHWEVYQFLGKLLPTVFVLRRR